jgi:hypothetical protein
MQTSTEPIVRVLELSSGMFYVAGMILDLLWHAKLLLCYTNHILHASPNIMLLLLKDILLQNSHDYQLLGRPAAYPDSLGNAVR